MSSAVISSNRSAWSVTRKPRAVILAKHLATRAHDLDDEEVAAGRGDLPVSSDAAERSRTTPVLVFTTVQVGSRR
ncbi:hypothetical protein [Prauserella cavernicola]|uniref:Uncharacterized protein n=1 Tax=Prauserella cavernicola TaxID=2800127 RepID=A0A934V669_9PSEU|nr:hypothetical protein [Prauserella cavernicola]MBK1787227.1 hypothetical protein [Prauserella cavernicola]